MFYPQRGHTAPRKFHSRAKFANSGVYIDVSRFVNKAIVTEATEHFVPEHSFADFKFQEILKRNIEAKGYVTLTPIQDQAIPCITSGKDIVGIANTGTGKTAAYLLPLINKIILDSREKVLIVVPTRELACQIDEELRIFAKNSNLFSVLCIGGMGMGKQVRELRQRHHFVIGTPGRLRDLMEQQVLDLSGFKTIVLDEADRMLDMGFIRDVRFMMSKMPKEKHTLFFSATLSTEIEKLIHEFLREPIRISVKTQETPRNVHQDVVRIPKDRNKLDILHGLLNQREFSKVLVFGRTKHGVERLALELGKRGFKAESIHGNKSQPQRQRALDLFKRDHAQVLTATDVAARGLDISDVTHVINFDLPATYDDYVHRIGRTGRGDKLGKALTFIE
ncbi:MAG: DEAD/DEAH RNA helicase [Parcubacteria group bacterium GW2011_GWC1_43_30]|nr:MAG: DEAD/DEAH RNA helicase [Parcubacteria group bacterium GW2011_GWC1_43_30]